MSEDHSIIVEYKYDKPLELLELTGSLSAIADEFKHFVTEQGGVAGEARLYVHELRSGSIIAELITLAEMANFLYEHRHLAGGFYAHFHQAIEAIRTLAPPAYKLPPRTIRNAAKVVVPAASDDGASVQIAEQHAGTIVNINYFGPVDARQIAANSDHLLNSKYPQEDVFSNEPMRLFQLRDAPPGKTGDLGRIDRFSPDPKKLTFANDAAKTQIVHHEGNPFDFVFWVDGTVKTVGGKVVGYHITNLQDATLED